MTSRRQFLAASAAALLSPRLARSANEEVRLAVIGPGGRGRLLMEKAASLPGVRFVSLCDVWTQALDQASKMQPGADRESDYCRVLDREDVDGVIVATPDHWHAKVTADAATAGKHVYVEKPVTHSRDDGEALIKAVRSSGQCVQVGTQQRSMTHLKEAKEIYESGVLGDLVFVRMTWNRNAERAAGRQQVDPATVDWPAFCGPAGNVEFDPTAMRSWRFFWPFGGGIFTDLMVHWVDTVQWITGLPAATWAASTGSFQQAAGIWETPDTVQCLLRFGDSPTQAHFAGTFSQHRERAMTELRGTKATLYLDRGRWELIPQKRSGVEERSNVVGTREKGSDFFSETDGAILHIADWLAASREGRDPATPIEAAVAAAETAHLANKALRGNGLATG